MEGFEMTANKSITAEMVTNRQNGVCYWQC